MSNTFYKAGTSAALIKLGTGLNAAPENLGSASMSSAPAGRSYTNALPQAADDVADAATSGGLRNWVKSNPRLAAALGIGSALGVGYGLMSKDKPQYRAPQQTYPGPGYA